VNWMIWRLHRTHLYAGLIIIGALGVLLGVTGAVMAHDYHQALSTCAATNNCGDLRGSLFQGDGFIIDTVAATMFAPLLLGIFWGAPLIASEFEEGTQDLAWTQSVTRRRWITANIAQAFLVAAAWGGAIAALVSWWRIPENALNGALPAGAFDIQGLAPIAYAIFAMSLGIAAGVAFRRTVTAIGSTLGVFVAARVLILQFARPHYLPAATHSARLTVQNLPISPRAWLLHKGVANAAGVIVDNKGPIRGPGSWVPTGCQSIAASVDDQLSRCLAHDGYHWVLTYQPASRFWAFQGIEAAIFVVLAVFLAAFTYRKTLRSDA
jgi:hypothetical protein